MDNRLYYKQAIQKKVSFKPTTTVFLYNKLEPASPSRARSKKKTPKGL